MARRFLALAILLVLLPGFAILPDGSVPPAQGQAITLPAGIGGPETARMTSASLHKEALPEAVPSVELQPGRAVYPGCLDHPEAPVIDYATDNLALTDIAMIATCGWEPGETVSITLMDPRGKISTSTVEAVPSRYLKNVYEADFFYQPGVDAAPGKYRFTLKGSMAPKSGEPRPDGGILKAKLTFNRPAGARLYVQSGDPFHPLRGATGGKQPLRLAGFLPNEPVRLLAYTFAGIHASYYGWQDFTADRRGQLIVETDLAEIDAETEMGYFAYARETHFVPLERFTRDGYSITRQFDLDLYCPGSQPPRLSGTGRIQAAAGVTQLEIKRQPGFGAQLAAKIPADTEIIIYGFPKCIDHAYWWKVQLKQPPFFGWISETRLGKYLVEPAAAEN